MNKRRVLAWFILVAAVLLTAGCGKSAAGGDSPGAGEEKKPIILRMMTEYSLETLAGQYVQEFADRVEKDTNGQVKIEIYPNDQLYKSTEYHEAIAAGNADMALAVFGKGWPQIIPELNILGSMAFIDSYHALNALNGSLGERLEQLLEEKANTKVLGWTGGGSPDAMGTSKRLIQKPDDLKGLKMRIPTQAHAAFVETLGGAATLITPSEQYLALQNGTVDGIFLTTASGVVRNKLFEVAKYWTRIPLSVGVEHGFVINLDTWNKLPENVQQALEKNAKDLGKETIDALKAATEKDWEVLRSSPGVEIYEVPEEELVEWNKRIAPASTAVLEKVLSKEEVDELLKLVEEAK